MSEHKALSEFRNEYPWVEKLLIECMKNKLRLGQAVPTELENMTDEDATKIGQSLAAKLRARKSAAAGIDQWRLAYPALNTLMQKHRWFVASERSDRAVQTPTGAICVLFV